MLWNRGTDELNLPIAVSLSSMAYYLLPECGEKRSNAVKRRTERNE